VDGSQKIGARELDVEVRIALRANGEKLVVRLQNALMGDLDKAVVLLGESDGLIECEKLSGGRSLLSDSGDAGGEKHHKEPDRASVRPRNPSRQMLRIHHLRGGEGGVHTRVECPFPAESFAECSFGTRSLSTRNAGCGLREKGVRRRNQLMYSVGLPGIPKGLML